jgi:very-short-patch-repair endonuclease
MAAVLGAGLGAVASYRSAAWLWGLTDDLFLEVAVPKNRSPRLAGVAVHRQQSLNGSTSRRRGVPVTNPLRTLVDLASIHDFHLLDEALDRGIATRLFSLDAVEAELTRESRSGRRGTARLRERLEHRDASSSTPPSVLESRLGRLLRAARLPLPHREYAVMDAAYRLDFAWPEQKLAVELDGYASHSSAKAFGDDRSRQNELVLAGWTVLRFTWDDVCGEPDKVAGQIRAALVASRPA